MSGKPCKHATLSDAICASCKLDRERSLARAKADPLGHRERVQSWSKQCPRLGLHKQAQLARLISAMRKEGSANVLAWAAKLEALVSR